MISIEKFQEIRSSEHIIVLDTNVLLELYRQPANISLDIINALKKILSNIYVPRQVYDLINQWTESNNIVLSVR